MADKTTQAEQNRLHALLMNADEEKVAALLQDGAFADFGLYALKRPLPLTKIPPRMLLRWWALFYACGADVVDTAQLLGFSGCFAADMLRLVQVFSCPPKDMRAVKILLKDKLPEDVGETFCAFAAMDDRWQPAPALWNALRQTTEAYTDEQLALPKSAMGAFGVAPNRQAKVRALLLDAVIRAPELNRFDTLGALAAQFARIK